MPAKKGRTCFVPLCKGGYKSSAEKVSLFHAPTDARRQEEWARNIKREDKELDETSVVCSRHFDDPYIQRTFKHVINGQLVEIDRDRPALTEDAVPTLFPDAPSDISKCVPKKRKERNLAHSYAPAPKRRAGNKNVEDGDPQVPENESDPEARSHPFSDIALPSALCNRVVLTNDPATLCFGWHSSTGLDNVHVTKHLKFTPCTKDARAERTSAYRCSVLCRSVKVEEVWVTTVDDAVAALTKADSMIPCPGFEIQPVYPKQCVQYGGKNFAKNCLGTSTDGKPCLQCRYTKKLALNRSYRLKKKPGISWKQRSARKSLQLLRARRKLANAEKSVAELRVTNESIASSVLETKISGLPPKQRLAVKTCFEVARRKSSRGMLYDKLWILECILMRMQSPKLYEHVRRHEIMALPSKSCLDKHMQRFKGAFGFNTTVLAALREKTLNMDKFSLHGGLVFDEIKLSGNISVKPSGELTGFVDLGPFTEDSTSTATSDHGFVVMFKPFQGG
ncbi:uncharacterized protein LOC125942151 [Dermacentor silvarum]|uniref:uncharacterized protein LOC125942151 n=1 Tax=Dermacentor silvarum TaxID=543639 RepID=UPI0021016499|nr:uncharacterized protein LOC125942151 [Dermacentor silvarum]